MQGGGFRHGRPAVRERTSGELVTLARGRQIFENQREVVRHRIDFGEDRSRGVNGDRGRQLAIERDFADVKHMLGTGLAARGICGGKFADHGGGRVRLVTVISETKSITVADQTIADRLAGEINEPDLLDYTGLAQRPRHPLRIDPRRIGREQTHRLPPIGAHRRSSRFLCRPD